MKLSKKILFLNMGIVDPNRQTKRELESGDSKKILYCLTRTADDFNDEDFASVAIIANDKSEMISILNEYYNKNDYLNYYMTFNKSNRAEITDLKIADSLKDYDWERQYFYICNAIPILSKAKSGVVLGHVIPINQE
jgi:hypothetical protein